MNFHGFGKYWYGFTGRDAQGFCDATQWLCLFYFPVWPLQRRRIRPVGMLQTREVTEFAYESGERTPLVLREIVASLVIRWLVLPVVILWPMMLVGVLIVATDGEEPEPSPFNVVLVVLWPIGAGQVVHKAQRKRTFGKRSLWEPDPKIPEGYHPELQRQVTIDPPG